MLELVKPPCFQLIDLLTDGLQYKANTIATAAWEVFVANQTTLSSSVLFSAVRCFCKCNDVTNATAVLDYAEVSDCCVSHNCLCWTVTPLHIVC